MYLLAVLLLCLRLSRCEYGDETCKPGHYECISDFDWTWDRLVYKCIGPQERCNGVVDCMTRIDEMECPDLWEPTSREMGSQTSVDATGSTTDADYSIEIDYAHTVPLWMRNVDETRTKNVGTFEPSSVTSNVDPADETTAESISSTSKSTWQSLDASSPTPNVRDATAASSDVDKGKSFPHHQLQFAMEYMALILSLLISLLVCAILILCVLCHKRSRRGVMNVNQTNSSSDKR